MQAGTARVQPGKGMKRGERGEGREEGKRGERKRERRSGSHRWPMQGLSQCQLADFVKNPSCSGSSGSKVPMPATNLPLKCKLKQSNLPLNDLNPNGLGSACKILSQFCVPQSSAGHNIQNITTTLPLH